jgi:hypothetical protein
MANQIVVSAGAKVRTLSGVLTATSGVVSSVPLGAANGVATLDSGGKVPVSQLPSSVVTYLGTWNAATNTPTLVNGVGDAGDMYICNVAGTVNFGAGPVVFAVGDWVLYGSGTWQKSSGQNGTVTSVAASITGNSVGITGSPISTAGTLAFAFAGTNLQYVNGAGNLTTFPDLTGFVPYTGATANVNIGTHSFIANNGTYNSEMSPSLFGVENAAGTIFGVLEYNKLTLTNSTGAGSVMEVNAQGLIFPDASVQISSYTDAKARLALSLTTTGTSGVATYNNTTGVFNIPNYGSALSGYLPLTGGTLTGALNITLSSGDALNVAGNAIFRGDTGVATPRQLIISSGGSTPVYLSAKGYGANYQTDFGIRTFNSVGTSFEVFYATSSGNVGINQTSPAYLLDVNGTGRFTGALGGTSASFSGAMNADSYGMAGAVQAMTWTTNTLRLGQGSYWNKIELWNGTRQVLITTSTENVLIGTTDDTSNTKLVLYSTSAASQIKAAGTAPAITFSNTITSPTIGGSLGACTSANQFITGTAAGDMVFVNQFTGSLILGTNSAARLTISNAGAATFSSSVTATEGKFSLDSGTEPTYTTGTAGKFIRSASGIYGGVRVALVGGASGGDNGFDFYNTSTLVGQFGYGAGGQQFYFTKGVNMATTSGNVGIGTSSPSFASGGGLAIYNATRSNLSLTDNTNTLSIFQQGVNSYLNNISTGDMIFRLGTGSDERMRITGGGQILMGTTTALQSTEKLAIASDYNTAILAKFTGGGTSGWAGKFWNNGTTGDNLFIEFQTETSITARGSITYNRSAGLTVYNTTSDYRLKSEISDFNALNIINNLKPKEFRIGEAVNKSIGFIAHELQEYFPQAVSGKKDAIDENGIPIYQTVDYSQLTGLLVKAIQEQQKQIEELKLKIK